VERWIENVDFLNCANETHKRFPAVVVSPANDPATRDNFAAVGGPGSGPDASQMKDSGKERVLLSGLSTPVTANASDDGYYYAIQRPKKAAAATADSDSSEYR
jgi:hypothetical protein